MLALNVFILEIDKETFNYEELKQGQVEPIKEETPLLTWELMMNLRWYKWATP